MLISTLFFDLDDTLYPNDSGLWQAIRARMGQYMIEVLGLPADQVPEIRKHYFQTYGTTLRGLQKHHQVNADDYLAYVHDLSLEDFLHPDPALRCFLENLPQKRFIFTNADSNHARRVLQVLGVQDCFNGIIDVRAIEFACKPDRIAYTRALALSGEPLPETCVMVDDSIINLAPARELGFTTVHVGREPSSGDAAVYSINSVIELTHVMPELWDGKFRQENSSQEDSLRQS